MKKLEMKTSLCKSISKNLADLSLQGFNLFQLSQAARSLTILSVTLRRYVITTL